MNLIEQSPDKFRRTRLKGGRPGIAMVGGAAGSSGSRGQSRSAHP